MGLSYYSASVVLLGIVLLLSLDYMGLFSWKNHLPVDGRTVLLTGASQGMGRSVARILASKGANVILVARTQSKLDEAAKEATAAALRPTQRFHTISADVTSEAENARILREATEWNNGTPPDIVWTIAGAAAPMLFVEASTELLRRQMDINYWSCAYLGQQVLKAWMAQDSGPKTTSDDKSEPPTRHLIFTSSVVAFCSVAGYGPYGPTKAAIRSLSDCLRSEINFYNGARRRKAAEASEPAPPPTDIQIHTVFPGTISSPGLELENSTKHDITQILEDVDPVQTPDEVAIKSIRGLERGDYFVVTNYLGQAMRGAAWMGSPRGSWWQELFWAWISSIIWIFVGPDMERSVWNYGKKWGLKGKPKNA